MPQLVGLPCIHCKERIGDEFEGQFCPACSSPVHKHCANEKLSTSMDAGCRVCRASTELMQQQAQRLHSASVRRNAARKQQIGVTLTGAGCIAIGIGLLRLFKGTLVDGVIPLACGLLAVSIGTV